MKNYQEVIDAEIEDIWERIAESTAMPQEEHEDNEDDENDDSDV